MFFRMLHTSRTHTETRTCMALLNLNILRDVNLSFGLPLFVLSALIVRCVAKFFPSFIRRAQFLVCLISMG
ncbi:hypothetical protein CDL12_28846 [Handroanthus impetiginosus]|uniref:Uncharacterized protein n=1 Tax=Handroanthus impetiginosus TaxID=429701 RepID=A0A2G9G041_9LAMI|nr:hypothetical protein CDL12_28846 [Handroanthus impetiginosus]